MVSPELFNAAAAAVCVYSALKGRSLLQKKMLAKKASYYAPYYVPDTLLADGQRDSLANDLNQVLTENKAKYLLIGDASHVDMRAFALLADPRVLKALAQHNVKQIFLERPRKAQRFLDALRSRSDTPTSPWDESHPMKKIDDNLHRLTKELVDHAAAEGIRVIAADKNPTTRSKILDAFTVAKCCAADAIRSCGLYPIAYDLERSAHESFARERLKDAPVAEYIRASTAEGTRSLVFWGNSHVVTGGEDSLKRNLDDCVSLSVVTDENSDLLEQDAFGFFSAPRYIINIEEGRIKPFQYSVRKNPYLSALRERPSNAHLRTSKPEKPPEP